MTDDALAQEMEGAAAAVTRRMNALDAMFADVAAILARIRNGAGAAGRLLTDDGLVVEMETAVAGLNVQMDDIRLLVVNAADASGALAELSANLQKGTERVPALVANADRAVASIGDVGEEAQRTLPAATAALEAASEAARDLPLLLSQAQKTMSELETLSRQLQGAWLLGGAGAPVEDGALAPGEV
ncbi:hypothetical protein G5B40_05140 [Pikeienuella piscinae]|uniref:Uncharacterized protein n=1 Tax=Pikeienuella piscinae TaxID=2748098 RepID=A0A7L5BWG7_9RHOB|nr:hypothetical protein [Pikeienuella piscinae]QIE54887.1 hypothetical protein G5B40_05140 [Pikeienuella piscinae]